MTLHVLISGSVQGVGFRQYIKYKAGKLNVYGWVKNLSSGKVEAVLQGDEEDVSELLKICRIGPFLASVKNVEVKEIEDERKYEEFEVR